MGWLQHVLIAAAVIVPVWGYVHNLNLGTTLFGPCAGPNPYSCSVRNQWIEWTAVAAGAAAVWIPVWLVARWSERRAWRRSTPEHERLGFVTHLAVALFGVFAGGMLAMLAGGAVFVGLRRFVPEVVQLGATIATIVAVFSLIWIGVLNLIRWERHRARADLPAKPPVES